MLNKKLGQGFHITPTTAPNSYRVVTPFMDPINDQLIIYLIYDPHRGQYQLTDDGFILDEIEINLTYQSANRQAIDQILSLYHIKEFHNALVSPWIIEIDMPRHWFQYLQTLTDIMTIINN